MQYQPPSPDNSVNVSKYNVGVSALIVALPWRFGGGDKDSPTLQQNGAMSRQGGGREGEGRRGSALQLTNMDSILISGSFGALV